MSVQNNERQAIVFSQVFGDMPMRLDDEQSREIEGLRYLNAFLKDYNNASFGAYAALRMESSEAQQKLDELLALCLLADKTLARVEVELPITFKGENEGISNNLSYIEKIVAVLEKFGKKQIVTQINQAAQEEKDPETAEKLIRYVTMYTLGENYLYLTAQFPDASYFSPATSGLEKAKLSVK